MSNYFSPDTMRQDFPILKDGLHYLDSAATSLTPEPVIRVMDEYYRDYRANIHRGLYGSAVRASRAYEEAHHALATFIGASDPSEVIFTAGATASANMLTSMLAESDIFREGDSIVSIEMEHHAALVPLQQIVKKRNLSLGFIPLHGTRLDMDAAIRLVTPQTKLVSVMLASNVLGTINDVAAIAEAAKKVGALTVVDATAAVGHIAVDVKKLGADLLYFSAHKMLGPTGIGVLWIRSDLGKRLYPAVWGGGMIARVTLEDATWADIPERFEPGTPNIAGAIGFHAAVSYLELIGVSSIHDHVSLLVKDAAERLSAHPGVHVLSEKDPAMNVGNISFTVDGLHPHDLAQILADRGVAVRAGHHCAMPLHAALGVQSSTRASYYLYNTTADTDALIQGIEEAQRIFLS
jgi:cysteine desulfurase/selenocysteine lyase